MSRFAVTVVLSAFLLFLVQPLMGKVVLPWFGGASAVWTTCLLFFQLMLLGGYAWSHLVVRRLRGEWQRRAHLILLGFAAFTLVPLMPMFGLHPIVAIAIGTLLGGVAQLALQWPTLHKEGFRYHLDLDWRDEGLHRMLTLMGPGTIGMAATQVNVFVNTVLATSTVEGAVSWLNYAFRLMYLPIGLFGVSIATAALPAVSRQSTLEDSTAVRDTVSSSLSLMLMLNIPATVGLVVLAEPIVRVVLERGAFTSTDTVATAAALQFYAVGLIGYSVVRIVSPIFFALGRHRTPVAVSTVVVLINASLNYILVQTTLSYRGLALGTSIAALINAGTLLVLLRAHLHGLNEGRLFGSVTSQDVVEYLGRNQVTVEKRRVLLEEPIKALGDYEVPIRLHHDVTATLKVPVTRE